MIKYAFQINSIFAPYAMAGLSLGLLTGAKFEATEGNSQDEKDNTNSFDLGLGLANINSEADESKVKNRGIQAVVGVTIPVGPK